MRQGKELAKAIENTITKIRNSNNHLNDEYISKLCQKEGLNEEHIRRVGSFHK